MSPVRWSEVTITTLQLVIITQDFPKKSTHTSNDNTVNAMFIDVDANLKI